MTSSLLLSGGMDSIAIAYWQRPDIAFTVDYGQRPASAEVRASAAVCRSLSIRHEVLNCDVSKFGSGDLAESPAVDIAPAPEWWPFRNQFLVTVAAMRGIGIGVTKLMIGCLRTDGFHADGTFGFIEKMNELLLSQEGGIALEAPAIGMRAQELLTESQVPPELLAWAHSCHVGEYACGYCRGCRKHYETLQELGERPY